MAPSDFIPQDWQSAENEGSNWVWLQQRLERAEKLEASHMLDEWILSQLSALESTYANWTTVCSSQRADGLLVRKSGR